MDDEDYPLVSKFSWHITKDGEAATYINGDEVEMKYIIVFPELAKDVDGVN